MRGERILLIQESFCIIFIRKTINIVVNLIFFFTIKTLLENTKVLLVKSSEDARNLSKKSIRQRQKGTHEAHRSVTYKREMLRVS